MRYSHGSTKTAVAVIIGLVFASDSLASQQIESSIAATLDSIVVDIAEAYDVPGVSVAIVNSEGIAYEKSFGVRSLENREPVSNTTIFRTGSISKVFTATAVMQLHERGLVDLNVPVHEYVPFFRMNDPEYQNITVMHLLTHTSGLPGDNTTQSGSSEYDEEAISRYVRELEDKPLEFSPGAAYAYNNNGFVVLSSLVEEVTGEPFVSYVREHILEPLEMSNSTFAPLTEEHQNVAALHVIGDDFQNSVREHDSSAFWKTGAGGLKSTIGDLSQFARSLLNTGRGGQHQVIGSQSLLRMWEQGVDTGNKGLAWSVYSVWGGRKLVDHGGNSIGYSAEIALLPDDDIAVIVLCNNRNGAEWPLARALLRTSLGLELGELRYSPDYWTQRLLREEGPDSALNYFERTLRENEEDVASYDMMLLAYRLVQGSGESNLETSKAILELLSEHFPDDPRVDSMLGEIYLRLAKKYYRTSLSKNPSDWPAQLMLEQLERVVLDHR